MAKAGTLGLIPRLVRVQFTPIIIAPVVLGTAVAWNAEGSFSAGIFLLALAGSVSLHLAANTIDDVYDFINGTDKVAEQMFPPDAPGWKPVARGLLSVGQAFAVSYLLYGVSVLVGVLLSLLVGWYALLIAMPGILLSYFYTAPPLRLDYRGVGLGELSILLSFGPIPAVGAYYVMTGHVSSLPLLIALPTGLLTTSVLVSHDLIYYDVYKRSGKRSLTVVLGRQRGAVLSSSLAVFGYALLLAFVIAGLAPSACLLAFIALPLFLRVADFVGRDLSPPEYGRRTATMFLHSTLFTLLVALGFLAG